MSVPPSTLARVPLGTLSHSEALAFRVPPDTLRNTLVSLTAPKFDADLIMVVLKCTPRDTFYF